MSDEFGLKRVLGLWDLVAIEIGTTVGAGIFSLTALTAGMTGPSVPLAFLAAAVPIVFIMMTVGYLGSAMPTVGGTYRYPSRLFSPLWATVGVWCAAMGMVFGGLPMYATECVRYLQALWPGIPLRASAIGLITVFYLVNIFGVSVAASIQAGMVAVLILALLVFGIGGIPSLEPDRFTPLFSHGATGFILAACILTFALQGSNSVIELGAEIKNPGRNIPRSLLISIPVVALVYVLVSISAVGSIGLEEWTSFGKDANLTQPAAKFLSRPLFLFFLVGGAMFAFTTTINGAFILSTKSLMVVAKDRIIPPVLARTTRFGSPAISLTIVYVLAVIAVLINAGVEIFASFATIGGMIIFIPSMIAAILLPKKAPELYSRPGFRLRGPMLYIAPGIGIITSVLLIVILLVNLGYWSLTFLVWFALGFGFYYMRKSSIEKSSGEAFSDTIEKDLKVMIEDALKSTSSKKNP